MSRLDQKRVQAFHTRLAEIWSEPNFYGALEHQLRALVDHGVPWLIDWVGEQRTDPKVLLPLHDWRLALLDAVPKVAWRKSLPFDPHRPDPMANQVLHLDDLSKQYPRKYAIAKKLLFRPLGVRGFCRCTYYLGREFVGVGGYVAYDSSEAVSRGDAARFQAVVPRLVKHLWARRQIDRESPAPGTIDRLADALRCPAFILSDTGIIVHANEPARRAYPNRPGWMQSVTSNQCENALPPWVRRVPLNVGDKTFFLLLPEDVPLDLSGAHEPPWVRAWNLPTRYARVAACMMRGLSDKEIALDLGLSHATARTYAAAVLRHAGVSSRSQLLAAATQGIR